MRERAAHVAVTFLELRHTAEKVLIPVEVAQFARLHVPNQAECWPAILAELARHGVTGVHFRGYTRAALYGPPDSPTGAEP